MKRFYRGCTAFLLLLFGLIRFAHWDGPLTTDEAYTLNYVSLSADVIRKTYDAPNNHILLSLILRGIDVASPKNIVFTAASLKPLRLPSILASIASLLMLYLLGASLYGRRVAVLAVALLGISSWHLAYAPMLRGYSLASLLLPAVCWLLHRALAGSKSYLLLLPAVLAATLYLLPSNAFFIAPLLAWAAWTAYRGQAAPGSPVRVAAAATAGLLLAAWLYAPVASALTTTLAPAPAEGSLWSSAIEQARQWLLPLGAGWPQRALLLLLSLLGAAVLARRGRAASPRAVLLPACVLAPLLLLLLLLGRAPAPARVFVPLLPFWALLGGVGLNALLGFLRARRRTPRPLHTAGAAVAVVLLAGAPRLYAHVDWNRGLDLRRPMNAVARLALAEDDFAVILPASGSVPVIDQLVDWEYHANCVGLRPYLRAFVSQEPGYWPRRRYFLVARDESEALAMLERSRVDPLLRARLRPLAAYGRLRVFSADLDASALDAYRAAAVSQDRAARAAALAALGVDALLRDAPQKALPLLSRAALLRPKDPKTRFLKGYAHYLLFEDAPAAEELAWVVAHDTGNYHAPLYLADAQAGLGRVKEAAAWYGWYRASARGWFLAERAEAGRTVLEQGLPPATSALGLEALLTAVMRQGAYERASRLLELRARGDSGYLSLSYRGEVEFRLLNFARAAGFHRQALLRGAGIDSANSLTNALRMKLDIPEARRAAADVLSRYPADPTARVLMARTRRERPLDD